MLFITDFSKTHKIGVFLKEYSFTKNIANKFLATKTIWEYDDYFNCKYPSRRLYLHHEELSFIYQEAEFPKYSLNNMIEREIKCKY